MFDPQKDDIIFGLAFFSQISVMLPNYIISHCVTLTSRLISNGGVYISFCDQKYEN